MAQSINLIPQEELREQVQVQVVKASTIVMIVLLVVVAGISGYLFYTTTKLEEEIAAHEQASEGLRTQIQSLADIEIVTRNLDKKYRALSSIFSEKVYYSILADELRKRAPGYVTIADFSMRGAELSLSGEGSNYIAISEFLSNLTEPTEAIVTPGLEELFFNVTLNSVTLDSRSSNVKYFITAEFDLGMLAK